jgi:hypothetical protein
MRFHDAGFCGRGGPSGSSKPGTRNLGDHSAYGSSTSSVGKASQFCLARLRCKCFPAYSVPEGMDVCRAATEEELAELPAADELQQGAIAVLPILPEPGRPIILPLLPQAGLIRGGAHPSASLAYNSIWLGFLPCDIATWHNLTLSVPHADSGVLPPLEASVLGNQLIIEGIRHRILAHLFRQRSAEGPSSGALRRFFFHFQEYASIIIWKASLPVLLQRCLPLLIPMKEMNFLTMHTSRNTLKSMHRTCLWQCRYSFWTGGDFCSALACQMPPVPDMAM